MTPLRGLAARARGDERGDLPVVTVLILFLAAAIMAVLTGTVSDATSTIGATASAARNASAVELATSAADAFYGQLEADPSHVSSIWPYLDVWAQFAPSGSVEACSSGIHNDCFRLDVKVSSSGQAGVTATQVGPSSPAGLPQQAATLTVTASVDCRMGGTVANPTPTCSTNTIVQHLRRRTFLDYLYFVDHNSLDPNVAKTVPTRAPTASAGPASTTWGRYPVSTPPGVTAVDATATSLYLAEAAYSPTTGTNVARISEMAQPVEPTTAAPTRTTVYQEPSYTGPIRDVSVAADGDIGFQANNISMHAAGSCTTCSSGSYGGYQVASDNSPSMTVDNGTVYYTTTVRYCRYRYNGRCAYSFKEEDYELTPAQFAAGSPATQMATHAPPFDVSPNGSTLYTTALTSNYYQTETTNVDYPICAGVAAISAASNTETACYKVPGATNGMRMAVTGSGAGLIYLAVGNDLYKIDPSTGSVGFLTTILSSYYDAMGYTPGAVTVSPTTGDVYVLETSGSAPSVLWQLKPPGTYVADPPAWNVDLPAANSGTSVTAGSGQVFVGQPESSRLAGETQPGYAFYQPYPPPPATSRTYNPFMPPPAAEDPSPTAGYEVDKILATRSGYVYYEVAGVLVLHAPDTCSSCYLGYITGNLTPESVVGNDLYVAAQNYECLRKVGYTCEAHGWVTTDYELTPSELAGATGGMPSNAKKLPTAFNDFALSPNGSTIYHPGGCEGVEAVDATTGAGEHCYYIPIPAASGGSGLRGAPITVGPHGHVYVVRPLVGPRNTSTNRQVGHQVLRVDPATGAIEDIGMPDSTDNFFNSAIDELSVSPTTGDLYVDQWFYSSSYLSKLAFYSIMVPPHSAAVPTRVVANPAYQGSPATGDVIDGPVHTNSGPIPVCGSPTFAGAVEVSGASSGPGWTQASGQGCANSAPKFTNPAGGVTTGSPVLPLPASDSSLEQIAAAGGSPWPGQTGYAFAGDITVTIDGDTLDVTDPSGATHTGVAFPVTGVIYATGDIKVSGANDGRLTLAAGGSITVTGNLDYGCAGPGVTPVPGSCRDVTGLVAQGNIWLYDTGAAGPSTADLEAASFTVDAAMLSLSNSVDATGPGGKPPSCPIEQLSGGATSLCPTLTVNGAMATSYRGLFGFYDGSSGELVAGWHKDFVYDARLFHLQPPWFLTPLAGQWVRSSPAVVGAAGS